MGIKEIVSPTVELMRRQRACMKDDLTHCSTEVSCLDATSPDISVEGVVDTLSSALVSALEQDPSSEIRCVVMAPFDSYGEAKGRKKSSALFYSIEVSFCANPHSKVDRKRYALRIVRFCEERATIKKGSARDRRGVVELLEGICDAAVERVVLSNPWQDVCPPVRKETVFEGPSFRFFR